MAGLLDSIFPSSDGGGLLDFLKRNMQNQPMPAGLPSDQAQYGQPAPQMPQQPQSLVPQPQPQPQAPVPQNPPPILRGSPLDAQASANVPQQPQPQAPAPAPIAMPSPTGNPLSNFLSNAARAITNIPRAGQDDPQTIALRQQAQTASANFQALVSKGVPRNVAFAAVQPGNAEMLKNVWDQANAKGSHTTETDKDGNVFDVGPDGKKTLLLQPKDDSFEKVEVKDGMGNVIGVRNMNKKTGEFGPVQTNGPVGGGDSILGDPSKNGAEYIASLPAKYQDTVKGLLDGTFQPPVGFSAAKPYWQQMLAAAKHADPTFDENNFPARRKMSIDLASSGNSTMGGILSNGESSFKHLAEYTGSVVDQGNASHDFVGGGALAHAQNYLRNGPLAGSNQDAQVKAINDNLGHYGQESTKFYAGTGGGVEERMNALHEMNAKTTSGEEAAAYAEKEKGLMLDRLNTKLREIKDTMGEDQGNRIIAKHMPDIRKNLKTINDNIDRLRGIKPGAPGSASFGSTADVAEPTAAPATSAPAIPKLKVGESHDAGGGVVIKKISEGNQ